MLTQSSSIRIVLMLAVAAMSACGSSEPPRETAPTRALPVPSTETEEAAPVKYPIHQARMDWMKRKFSRARPASELQARAKVD